MNVKISKFVNLKILAVTLAVVIAIMPFFQPKKVQASPLLLGITALLTTGMIAGRYVQTNVLYTPEQMNQINEKWTANLQTAFPDPTDYNHQMNVLQNLNQKLLNGEEVDWSKYSGKALYAVLKGVVDVVWPSNPPETLRDGEIIWRYTEGGYITWKLSANGYGPKNPVLKLLSKTATEEIYTVGKVSDFVDKDVNISPAFLYYPYGSTLNTSSYSLYGYWVKDGYIKTAFKDDFTIGSPDYELWMKLFFGQNTYVPDISAKTANKVKLPTRLPQTVINNINNYYNGDTENLTIAPTLDELPILPDEYNPNTDELPDLPGYQDVTPDQEATDTPDPTPTPVEPTPTPEGDYNGDRWVNPIGDFFDGLLKFMKAAFIPTLSLNLDALSAVPDNLGEKFPFSLPSDIIGMMTLFQAEPVPIEISFNIPTHIFGYQDIPIKGDTSFMDDYMPAIRNLIFLIFLFSLAWSTFNMFFGGGDD